MTARPHIGLFWRLFVPSAVVLATACVVLMVQPPNGRVPVLVSGLVVLLAVQVLIVRRAVAPLLRLTELTQRVDPLQPGHRVVPTGPPSEVTVLADAFNTMLDRLEEERSSSGRRALVETEAERRRLAGELHDEVGQSLTAIALHLDRTAKTPPTDPGAELAGLREDVLRVVEDVRGMASRLRPEALDTLGLVPALTNLTERLGRHAGLPVARELQRDLPPLSPEAELVLYRVAQEGLTNAVRHAAPAHLLVRLQVRDGAVRLLVRDDGAGLPAGAPRGTGITLMRERAVAIGARLVVTARADAPGTDVELVVPAGGPG